MKPAKDFPYHCDGCLYWRHSQTDEAHVCMNIHSPYYGEIRDADDACVKYYMKEANSKRSVSKSEAKIR